MFNTLLMRLLLTKLFSYKYEKIFLKNKKHQDKKFVFLIEIILKLKITSLNSRIKYGKSLNGLKGLKRSRIELYLKNSFTLSFYCATNFQISSVFSFFLGRAARQAGGVSYTVRI